MTDRQAADAVRGRVDWKYCLSMELTDPGFAASVLSEFRARLAEGDRADRLLVRMLEVLREHGLLAKGGPLALRAQRRIGRGRTAVGVTALRTQVRSVSGLTFRSAATSLNVRLSAEARHNVIASDRNSALYFEGRAMWIYTFSWTIKIHCQVCPRHGDHLRTEPTRSS